MGKKWKKVELLLQEENFDYEVCFSKYHLHAMEIAHDAANNYDIVVAVGGDGTVHEVANGLYNSESKLGLLPLGNGNDYGHLLRYKSDTLYNLQILKEAHFMELNVGIVETEHAEKRYFINIAEVGITSIISQASFVEAKWLRGWLKYYLLALKKLLGYKNIQAHIRIDGRVVLDSPIVLCAVGLGYRFGGGFKVLPGNHPLKNDFAICIGGDVSRLRQIYLMNLLKNGKHIGRKDIYFLRGKEVDIELQHPIPGEAEGEIFSEGSTKFTFRLAPHPLKVIVPKNLRETFR